MRPEKSWPAILSYLFHPLFIPLYAVASFFAMRVDFLTAPQKYLVLLQVFMLTVVIPILFFLLLRSLGRINSVMIPEASQRRWPLIFQMVLLFLLIQQSLTADFSVSLHYFFLGAIISTGLALLFVLANIKVSLHVLSMSAWLAFTIAILWRFEVAGSLWLAILSLLTGAVMSARLFLKAHSPIEIGLGFVCGFLPQIFLWQFWI